MSFNDYIYWQTLKETGKTPEEIYEYNHPEVVIHIEVKRVEKLNIETAMEQSIHDARYGEKPAVFHRRDRKQWLVTMPFSEWIDLFQAWEKKNG